MDLLSRFYNEEKFRRNAEQAMDIADMGECQSWLKHPCTQALRNMISADICGVLNVWLAAGYADEKSIDASVQREAKARGMAQALDDILGTIEEIGYKRLEGDDYDQTNGTSYPS